MIGRGDEVDAKYYCLIIFDSFGPYFMHVRMYILP